MHHSIPTFYNNSTHQCPISALPAPDKLPISAQSPTASTLSLAPSAPEATRATQDTQGIRKLPSASFHKSKPPSPPTPIPNIFKI